MRARVRTHTYTYRYRQVVHCTGSPTLYSYMYVLELCSRPAFFLSSLREGD